MRIIKYSVLYFNLEYSILVNAGVSKTYGTLKPVNVVSMKQLESWVLAWKYTFSRYSILCEN